MAHGICILTPPPIPGVEPIGAPYSFLEPRFNWDPQASTFGPAKAATGATWARIGNDWQYSAYPNWNSFDFSRLRRMRNAAHAAGFKVLLTTGYGHTDLPGNSWKWRYAILPEYLVWVDALASIVMPDAMEFVNEPNLPLFCAPVPSDSELLHANLEFGQVVAARGILPVLGALAPVPPAWVKQDVRLLRLLDRHAPIKWAISTHGYGSFVDIERQIQEARAVVRPTRKLWMTEAGIDLSKEFDDVSRRLAVRLVQSLDDRYTTPFIFALNTWEADGAGREFDIAGAFGLPTSAQLIQQWTPVVEA